MNNQIAPNISWLIRIFFVVLTLHSAHANDSTLKAHFSGDVLLNDQPIGYIRPITQQDKESFTALNGEKSDFIKFFSTYSGYDMMFNNNIRYQQYKLENTNTLNDFFHNLDYFTLYVKKERLTMKERMCLQSSMFLGLFTSTSENLVGVIRLSGNYLIDLEIKIFTKYQHQGWGKLFCTWVIDKIKATNPDIFVGVEIDIRNIHSLKLFNSLSFHPYSIKKDDTTQMLHLSHPLPLTVDLLQKSIQFVATYMQAYYLNSTRSLINEDVINSKQALSNILQSPDTELQDKISQLEELYPKKQ